VSVPDGSGEPRAEVVVAFPGGGGSSGMFDQLRKRLSGTADVIVPDTPGRGRRTRSRLTDVRAVAAELRPELRERIGDRPYVVFAACLGTLVGYELLRELSHARERMPVRFVVCGRPAPDLPAELERYVDWPDRRLDAFLRDTLPSDYDWDRIPVELRDIIRNRLKKDIELGAAYRHHAEERLQVPIHAYGGRSDTHITRDDLDTWRTHTAVEFGLHLVPGGAYFYLEDPDTIIPALIGRPGS
jgi:medium-chain acyl-[acyl-carrier-protein] hydrolase